MLFHCSGEDKQEDKDGVLPLLEAEVKHSV